MTLCLIDNIAFGGEGVGRIEGLAVFIPLTLPGEVVEIDIYQKKKNFARAKLQLIIEANPNRVIPPCPYFANCGGCQLQHASYSLQLQIKRKFIEDSLTRIGNIHHPIPPVTPSSIPFAYRRHISLKLKVVNDSYALGFTRTNGSHLPISSCLLLYQEQKETFNILPFLQTIFSKLDPLLPLSDSSVKIIKTPQNRYLICCSFSSSLPSAALELLRKSLSSSSFISGGILKTPQTTLEFGEVIPYFIHNGLIFTYSPFGFVQNHPEQSGNIYNWILKSNLPSKKALDLYCGVGASSILLAQEGKEVLGVELNPISIDLAIKNAKKNKADRAQFICACAETSLPKLLKEFTPDAIIVNPPKTGISLEALKIITSSMAETITYISCNPTTLARDLSLLLNKGFSIQDLQAFDMFPQTTHVETAVHLVRKK